MRITAVSLILLLLVCASVMSQTPVPTATPAVDGEVVKITTALIQLDVTVKDRNGRTVTDLRPDEFEVFENGEKQKITTFSFVSNAAATAETMTARRSRTNALPPTTATSATVRRSIALVVDDLNLSSESVVHVKRGLTKFVDEQMQEGDLVAIVRTGAGIGALQQFTNDKRQLHAAIDKLRWNPLGYGKTSTFEQLQPKYNARFPSRPPSTGERTVEGLRREADDYRQSIFASGTLAAVNFVVRGMQDLPGRKSIMLLSDGFRLYSEDALGFREWSRTMEALRRAVDAANRASVVIYTVEARGLEINSLTAADSTSGWSRTEIKQAESDRRNTIEDSQIGLSFLARETGGTAVLNTSDLGLGIRRILDDQSYYLIGYEPDDATFDPKARRFNNIEIRATRPDTFTRYRSGFFAVSDEKPARPQQTSGERLVSAMTSPFAANDIFIKLNALFYSSPKGGTVRSLVHLRAQDLTFTDEPDGRKKAVFDAVAVAFGDNGVAVEKKSDVHTIVLKKEALERLLESGLVFDFLFPVKKPGAYQLRVAIRDHASDKLGTASQFIDVPEMKQDRLVLSGVVLENIPHEDWQRQRNGGTARSKPDPLRDTSLRQFKRGTVVNYGFSIYNPKLAGGRPDISYRTSIFRNGKLIFEGKSQPILQSDAGPPINFTSALAIGSEMETGDYILQIVVTDNAANNTATQFVQFEII